MVKSYETLVDSDTKVDVNTGIVAAGRLQSLIDSRDYDHELLVMKVQMAAICAAVKSTVPQSMWGEIIEKLDEAEQHSEVLDVGRTPSMTMTTSPSIRPSSSTRTTSSDLRSARRHRGRWGPLPVWTQLFGVAVGKQIETGTPKSKASNRTLPMPDEVVDVLKAARKRQTEERLRFGEGYGPGEYVASDEQGMPYHPNLLTFRSGQAARRPEDHAGPTPRCQALMRHADAPAGRCHRGDRGMAGTRQCSVHDVGLCP